MHIFMKLDDVLSNSLRVIGLALSFIIGIVRRYEEIIML